MAPPPAASRPRPRTRTAALVVAGLLAVTGCSWQGSTSTGGGDARPSASPSPEPLRTATSAPGAELTVVGAATDAEAAIRTSQSLFDSSAVAVVVPTGRPDVQRLAAHASVALGVPLLVGQEPAPDGTAATSDATAAASDGALADELDRLGVRTVVVVGEVAGFTGDLADADAADSPDGDRTVVRSEPTAPALAAATGLTLDPAGPAGTADPAGFAAEVAALAPGTPAPSPAGTPKGAGPASPPASATGSPGDLAAVVRDAPLDDVVALAVDDPADLASVATARAAGVPVHLVPADRPNPQASAVAIGALNASTATQVLAIGAALGAEPALEWKIRSARTGFQLPGGGQVLFPGHQFVALYGSPVTSGLGLLGEQGAQASIQRAQATAAQYDGLTDRTVVPMFEMIATVAAGSAGSDGNFSNEQPVDVLRPWVEAAGAAGVYVMLDLQPGRSDFLTQARQYEELLRLPHVGLALDPEWRLGPDERPLQRIGSVGAAEVNSVVQWLADLTRDNGLPPKMFVLHQFRLDMLPDREAIDMSRPELAMVIHADGQGSQPAKQATWRTLHADAPAGVWWGWKNFIDEDLPMLTPAQTVQGVAPVPDLVTYQ